MEWLPIETAPKDEDILVFNAMTGAYRSRYQSSCRKPKTGEWPFYGWGNNVGIWYPDPSHWMPLPPAPKGE